MARFRNSNRIAIIQVEAMRRQHFNPSRWAHNRIWDDRDQTLCSRAHYQQHVYWGWAAFRIAMDALFYAFEKDHCQRSFDRYRRPG